MSENQWERLSNGNSPLAHKNLRSPLALPREFCKKVSLLGSKGSTTLRFRSFKVQNRNRRAIGDTASHHTIVPDETGLEFGGNCNGFWRTRSHLLPAPLGICYQHYLISSSIFRCHLIDIEPLAFESVEVRGFEPLAFSLRTRRSTN